MGGEKTVGQKRLWTERFYGKAVGKKTKVNPNPPSLSLSLSLLHFTLNPKP
jgi:hypothetical protein